MSAPTLEEIIETGIESALGAVETAQLGLVTSFDKEHHSVSVQPLFKKSYRREDGEIVSVTQPVIPNVPLWFNGAGGARMTFPVPKGSTVLLVHLSAAKAAWQFSGGTAPVDPGDTRRHTLTDCVAIPGGLTASVAARNFATGSSRIEDDAVILHTPGKIYLGGGLLTEPVIKATSFFAALDVLLQAIATAVGVSGTPATCITAGAAITAAFNVFSAGLLRDIYTRAITETE